MSQSDQFHESWAYLRDNAKPIREIDVWELREAREVHAPSKAHVKRIKRRRADVVPPSFKAIAVGDDPAGLRAKANLRAERARMVLAACGCLPTIRKAEPLATPALRPVPIVAEVSDKQFIETVRVDPGQKLAREHMLRMSKMVYREYAPSLDEINYGFGSVEAWEMAKAKG